MLLAAGACLEAPPAAAPDGDDCPLADAPPPDPLLGNVLTYTFDDDVTLTEVVHDSSGNRLDGALEGAIVTSGSVHGQNAEWTGNLGPLVEVPPNPLLHLGKSLTLEMWLWRNDAGFDNDHGLISIHDPVTGTDEVVLEVIDDGLRFAVTTGDCDSPATSSAEVPYTVLTVDQDVYLHVAVTWDGDQVGFYRNGELVTTLPLDGQPCPLERPLYIGATDEGLEPFAGWLDDVKVSNYVKTEDQIRASMNHDPSVAGPVCGNRLLESGESCEPPALCCDPATCRYGAASCGCAGECVAGLCAGGAGRTEDSLVALYDFEEGTGQVVVDASGNGLDLDIMGDGFTWGSGALRLTGNTALISGAAASSVVAACQESEEVSVEAWLTPSSTDDVHQTIAMLGLGDDCQGFALSQEEGRLAAAVSTDQTRPDGEPRIDAPDDSIATRLTQVVLTRAADGWRRLYLDGRLVSENLVGGNFSSWDPAQRITVGGPITGVSASCEKGEAGFWTGEFDRLAVYARALTPAEVAGNYGAGPEVAASLLR